MRRLATFAALILFVCVAGCATAAARKPTEIFVEPRFGVGVA